MQVTFQYLNYQGKQTTRTVTPDAIEYIAAPGYGYEPGWFLSGFDHDKKARRSFQLNNIITPDDLKFYKLIHFNTIGQAE